MLYFKYFFYKYNLNTIQYYKIILAYLMQSSKCKTVNIPVSNPVVRLKYFESWKCLSGTNQKNIFKYALGHNNLKKLTLQWLGSINQVKVGFFWWFFFDWSIFMWLTLWVKVKFQSLRPLFYKFLSLINFCSQTTPKYVWVI